MALTGKAIQQVLLSSCIETAWRRPFLIRAWLVTVVKTFVAYPSGPRPRSWSAPDRSACTTRAFPARRRNVMAPRHHGRVFDDGQRQRGCGLIKATGGSISSQFGDVEITIKRITLCYRKRAGLAAVDTQQAGGNLEGVRLERHRNGNIIGVITAFNGGGTGGQASLGYPGQANDRFVLCAELQQSHSLLST
ncbi:hypothetical protein N658DRAFT_559926 [Parathielavia hyrcaniae]|uniref:Uncharacterized protein n=1 Tax=Parathielavia hyrcaniae TaxID=113614 RepID=A0AAN6T0R3_9PEZI|nr:hypothetical protein N658DRAFT_559926 [Parathielavia hyrcaniae]